MSPPARRCGAEIGQNPRRGRLRPRSLSPFAGRPSSEAQGGLRTSSDSISCMPISLMATSGAVAEERAHEVHEARPVIVEDDRLGVVLDAPPVLEQLEAKTGVLAAGDPDPVVEAA